MGLEIFLNKQQFGNRKPRPIMVITATSANDITVKWYMGLTIHSLPCRTTSWLSRS